MAERPGVLRVGDRVLFGGGEHQVVGLAGNAVRLLAVSGQATVVALPFLLAAPDFAIVGTGTAAAGLAPQGLLDVLPEHVARAARDWERHLIEVLTGVPPDALPPALNARLFAAFGLETLWNKPGQQATVFVEITESTLQAIPVSWTRARTATTTPAPMTPTPASPPPRCGI